MSIKSTEQLDELFTSVNVAEKHIEAFSFLVKSRVQGKSCSKEKKDISNNVLCFFFFNLEFRDKYNARFNAC